MICGKPSALVKKEIKSGNGLRKLFANNHATPHQKMFFFLDLISDLDLLIRPLKRTKIFFFIFGLGSFVSYEIQLTFQTIF